MYRFNVQKDLQAVAEKANQFQPTMAPEECAEVFKTLVDSLFVLVQKYSNEGRLLLGQPADKNRMDGK